MTVDLNVVEQYPEPEEWFHLAMHESCGGSVIKLISSTVL